MTDARRLLRSRTFRITLIYLCVLLFALIGLLGAVYWSTTAAVSRHQAAQTELQKLLAWRRQEDIERLVEGHGGDEPPVDGEACGVGSVGRHDEDGDGPPKLDMMAIVKANGGDTKGGETDKEDHKDSGW